MDVKQVNLVYFSPTGSAETAVRLLGQAWGELPAKETDLSVVPEAQRFGSSTLVIWGVPSFGGRVPDIAAERFGRLRGDRTPCVLLTAYGNRDYDDTLLEMKDLAEEQGFLPVAAVAAVCEHSIARQYASGRPDARDRACLAEYGNAVRAAVTAWDGAAPNLKVKGNRPYKEKKGGPPMVPAAGKTCTGCMACAKACPVQAISYENVKKTDPKTCISCMRCVKVCPAGARKLPSMLLAAAGARLKAVCAEPKPNALFLADVHGGMGARP